MGIVGSAVLAIGLTEERGSRAGRLRPASTRPPSLTDLTGNDEVSLRPRQEGCPSPASDHDRVAR